MSSKEINVIQGNPTKSFFIKMITRDISIKEAILDLLDNSIDGANKIDVNKHTDLFIDITINENEFIVKDNCGGFSLETAQLYAFRFGRPDLAPNTSGSVGRFGIGMKRALFKMGELFEIETKAENEHFKIIIDVPEWSKKEISIKNEQDQIEKRDDWSFSYNLVEGADSSLSERGTLIHVKNLFSEVSELFKDQYFLSALKKDIEKILSFSIEKGLKISLNGEVLNKKDIFIFNELSKPYLFEGVKNDVRYKIIAGLSPTGDPSSAGWYIYCNDRLVLQADRIDTTGWGMKSVPKFHPDYAMFKGIVFMDADDSLNLPLTTTKKGIDASSEVYQTILYYMMEATQDVTTFLKQVRKLDDVNEYKILLGEQENKLAVTEMKNSTSSIIRKFTPPPINTSALEIKNEFVRISFDVDRNEAEKIRDYNGARNFKELGENVYEYYKKMEGLDYE